MKTYRALTVSLALMICGLALSVEASHAATAPPPWDQHDGILIQGATVVTMDDDHTVIPNGRVLVRDGQIVAIWSGQRTPSGVRVGDASVVKAGPEDLLFPGLINLHSHPRFNHLNLWPAPSSDAIPSEGKAGTDPYANRYQWGGASPGNAPPEHVRLVSNAADVLGADEGLGLEGEIVKYAEVAALLGGETAIQGAPLNAESDGVLIRNIDNDVFDDRIASPRVGSVEAMTPADVAAVTGPMIAGATDAWMIHLAEGVHDGDRRPGDTFSSRHEFDVLKGQGLLTDMTVVIHGTGLESADFADMRAAPSIREDGVGDGRGAKLVWSPLSNLLLYGDTTDALAASAKGLIVVLGTDWSPSGSRTLLRELKIADIAVRDPRIIGASRELVPEFAIAGKTPRERRRAEDALDRALVDMVTRNPAIALRWDDRVGSIEAGMQADLMLLRRPSATDDGDRQTVYHELIDSTERNVRLVLVDGDPLAGDVELMRALKRRDCEVVTSAAGRFSKAVDVTTTQPVPEGDDTLAEITTELAQGLAALGGDGQPGPVRTYSYLKAHVFGGALAGLPDEFFFGLLGEQVGVAPDGSLNLEAVQLAPLFANDDDFMWHLLNADVDPATGLIDDSTPPFALYASNFNQVVPGGNPFEGLPATGP